MTVISMILPFLLFGPVIDKLPGVGFDDKLASVKPLKSSVKMNSNTQLVTATDTVVDITGQSEISSTAKLTVTISTQTTILTVTETKGGVSTSKLNTTTMADVVSTISTTLPLGLPTMESTTKTTIQIETLGTVVSSLLYTAGNVSVHSVNSEEQSTIEGSTVTMKDIVKLSESTFSAIVRSSTAANIESTKVSNDLIESVVNAKTVAKYNGTTQTRAEGKTKTDVESDKLTTMECTTLAGASTEFFKDKSALIQIKARTKEISSTTTNKQHPAPETKGRSTNANGTSITTMDFETNIYNVRESPKEFKSSAGTNITSNTQVDVYTSTVTGKKGKVATASKSNSDSQYTTHYHSIGQILK